MEMGGNFCQILELGGTTIKGQRVLQFRILSYDMFVGKSVLSPH